MKELLQENERLDEVNDRLKLIQKTKGLTFGTDALLLAAFMRRSGMHALELGGGSGIISLLLSARERFTHILCAEVQEEYFDLCRRNIAINHLEERITAIHADIRETALLGGIGTYDAVFSNPPYMKTSTGAACTLDAKNTARHEVCGSIFDFTATAAKMLKYGGSFYAVYRTDRLTDLLEGCRANRLEPKRMTFVHGRTELAPSMVLLESRLGGKTGLHITPPLILTANGQNTPDYDYILEKGIFPTRFQGK